MKQARMRPGNPRGSEGAKKDSGDRDQRRPGTSRGLGCFGSGHSVSYGFQRPQACSSTGMPRSRSGRRSGPGFRGPGPAHRSQVWSGPTGRARVASKITSTSRRARGGRMLLNSPDRKRYEYARISAVAPSERRPASTPWRVRPFQHEHRAPSSPRARRSATWVERGNRSGRTLQGLHKKVRAWVSDSPEEGSISRFATRCKHKPRQLFSPSRPRRDPRGRKGLRRVHRGNGQRNGGAQGVQLAPQGLSWAAHSASYRLSHDIASAVSQQKRCWTIQPFGHAGVRSRVCRFPCKADERAGP